jgi:hypothetical protein
MKLKRPSGANEYDQLADIDGEGLVSLDATVVGGVIMLINVSHRMGRHSHSLRRIRILLQALTLTLNPSI